VTFRVPARTVLPELVRYETETPARLEVPDVAVRLPWSVRFVPVAVVNSTVERFESPLTEMLVRRSTLLAGVGRYTKLVRLGTSSLAHYPHQR
jgi:hypothetical protein